MATYCVTGAAGFIGSSLARALADRSEKVRGIDNLSGGSLDNLCGYERRIELHVADINDLAAVKKVVSGVDFVLHNAAIASVARSVDNPLATHEVNVNGTLNVLIAARDAGVKRVVFAASSSAYGDQPTQPNSESMVPCPLSPYAAQKIAGEHYMQVFSRAYRLPTVCLRYFNVFGPHQSADSPYSGVIAKFVNAMLRGDTPRIFGDGNQTRDFTYVSNVLKANILACEAPADAVASRIFNIGNGGSHTLNELYWALARIIGFDAPAVYADERPGDIRHSRASIELAQRYLGYTPDVAFEDGLQRTVDWYQGRRQPSESDLAIAG
jgi:UDP-glucose 4-epimerase